MEKPQHVALPLKYRPMTFDDVVGQEHVVRTLRHAIEADRIANAYLFIGPRGIGKTTLSRIFAKALNCTHPGGRRGEDAASTGAALAVDAASSPRQASTASTGVEPCGECTNCREIAAGASLDVTELDAASHNKVEDVKPIIDAVQFKPAASKYRIFIVDECHMLSNAAWNALLKTLEEPPPHVRFIFATTEGDKVLPTIVSRCQRFDLRRISTHDIVARLKYICGREKVDAAEDALLAIARGAEGGMRDALSSLDQLIAFKGEKITEEDALGVFGLVSRRALEGLAQAILTGDTAGILTAIETFDSAGKNMRRLAGELLLHFRNLVVVQALGPTATSLEATPDQIKVLEAQAKLVDASRVFRVCDQLAEMEDKLRYVLSVRTLIEMSLIRASRIATVASVEELMKAVRALKSDPDAAAATMPAVAGRRGEDAASTRAALAVDAASSPRQASSASPSASASPSVSSPAPVSPDRLAARQKLMDDPKLNDILRVLPGSTVCDVRDQR